MDDRGRMPAAVNSRADQHAAAHMRVDHQRSMRAACTKVSDDTIVLSTASGTPDLIIRFMFDSRADEVSARGKLEEP